MYAFRQRKTIPKAFGFEAAKQISKDEQSVAASSDGLTLRGSPSLGMATYVYIWLNTYVILLDKVLKSSPAGLPPQKYLPGRVSIPPHGFGSPASLKM